MNALGLIVSNLLTRSISAETFTVLANLIEAQTSAADPFGAVTAIKAELDALVTDEAERAAAHSILDNLVSFSEALLKHELGQGPSA